MKIALTFSFVLSVVIAFAQLDDSDFSNQVLTIGIHGRTTCQPPESSLRPIPSGGPWEEIMEKTNAETIGTGFVYEYNGEKYIITCEHVVFRASEIKAYDSAYNAYDLEYVGQDTFYDLTVLKFKNKSDASRFASAKLNTIPAVPGMLVWSVGYWEVGGTSSRRVGEVISGNAMIESDEVVAGKIDFIETTSRLLRGYSGGPLYNAAGEVLGMNTKRHNGYDKYYTLQSSTVKRVVQEIIDYGGVRRAYLGLRFSQSKRANEPVIIDAVLDDSPASEKKATLLNSQIKSINGKPIINIYDALKIMEQIPPDTEVNLEVNNSSNPVKIKSQTINNQRLKQIAEYAIRENTVDDCLDIVEAGTHVTLIRSNDVEMNIETVGFRLNEQDYLIYCLNDLVQFGTLTRLLGLYGRLEVDDHKRHFSPIKIRLSPTPNQRVLYY